MGAVLKKATILCLFIAFLLGLAELFLRWQPFVPLKYSDYMLEPNLRLSFDYHHKAPNIPPVQFATMGSGCGASQKALTLLFLGDSWMQSTDGIPKGVAEGLIEGGPKGQCIQIVNGGASSFAPSLMLVKGEQLIQQYRPDFVIANIDETDLMDEYLRYRNTTLRSADGRIERVVPNAVDMAMVYQRAVLNRQPMYLLRIMEQIYYENVLLPRLRREVYGVDTDIGIYDLIMSPQLSTNPRQTHAKEIEYFRHVLHETVERLSTSLPAGRLLITHHPHFLNLAQGAAPPRYSSIVSEILQEEIQSLPPGSVHLRDVRGDMVALYGTDSAKFFNWPTDPFSHLTPDGYLRYGRFIGRALQPIVGKSQR